jgi:hypothetical protein
VAEVEEEVLVELLRQGFSPVGDLHLVPPGPDRRHQHPSRVEVGVLVLMGQGPDDPDLETGLRQPLGDPLSPLDDGHGVLERGVEVEVVELVDAAEPIGVDMHQRRSAVEGWVLPGDHEGGRGDLAPHLEPLTDALRERRLSGPQLTAEHDQVTGAELLREGLAERPHRLGIGHVVEEGSQRPAQLDVG